MLGTHGVKTANRAVNDCDTLFLIGARVGDRAVKTPLALERSTKIIHIDIDPAEIGKNIGVDYPLVGDAKGSFCVSFWNLPSRYATPSG